MFFLRRTRPLRLASGRLRALRLSLNSPVVTTPDLPVGPARSAIALHAEPGRGLQLTVGVRSLSCGSVALYGFEGAIAPDFVQEALDGALSFAEAMGFLFDEEEVGSDEASQEKALVRWREAIGEGDTAEPVASEPDAKDLFEHGGGDLTDPPVSPVVPHTTLEIELVVAGAPDLGEPDPFSPEWLDFRPAAATPALALTKFRARPEPEVAPEAPAASERAPWAHKRTLGRVQLVKRRPAEPVQDARRGWLLRLLTSF